MTFAGISVQQVDVTFLTVVIQTLSDSLGVANTAVRVLSVTDSTTVSVVLAGSPTLPELVTLLDPVSFVTTINTALATAEPGLSVTSVSFTNAVEVAAPPSSSVTRTPNVGTSQTPTNTATPSPSPSCNLGGIGTTCGSNAECCSGTCDAVFSSACCLVGQTACAVSTQCCLFTSCNLGDGICCTGTEGFCFLDTDCCGGTCTQNACVGSRCVSVGGSCTTNSDCCINQGESVVCGGSGFCEFA
eukprot:c19086_g1_i4.p1 GENE.c19086_g1_i4~~c19086_g1_i4.p1  ORF type:complete len:244 (+),score=33.82 c19086_g1_i4:367-1098(+)